MKRLSFLLLSALVALNALGYEAQAEEPSKKESWFRRIFRRTPVKPTPKEGTSPTVKKAEQKTAQPRPAAPAPGSPTSVEPKSKQKDERKWNEEERKKLEEYLKRKRGEREVDADEMEETDPRANRRNKKDKKNKKPGKGPGWKQRGGLPPGLQKKVERGGQLPPGWQKKLAAGEVMDQQVYTKAEPIPQDVFMSLPPQPYDTEIVTIEDKVVRVMKDTRRILDVFGLGDVLNKRDDAPARSQ